MDKKKSAATQVLLALIPYSRQNLMLSFKPNSFFNELEKTSGYSRHTLRVAYKRAANNGLIEGDQAPRLSKMGRRKIKPFTAPTLGNRAKLIVIFDVPEENALTRQKFRSVLKGWGFEQVQKSVWSSEQDYREDLLDVISELGIGQHVQIYEGLRLFS